jgi:hypothetical protein
MEASSEKVSAGDAGSVVSELIRRFLVNPKLQHPDLGEVLYNSKRKILNLSVLGNSTSKYYNSDTDMIRNY